MDLEDVEGEGIAFKVVRSNVGWYLDIRRELDGRIEDVLQSPFQIGQRRLTRRRVTVTWMFMSRIVVRRERVTRSLK
jgi:hypothetical protein